MSKQLEILVDGEVRVRFDSDRSLPGLERSRLDQLDEMLEQGIGTGPGRIERPNVEDKTRFVVGELIKALLIDDELAIARLCALLIRLQPQLAGIEASKRGEDMDVRLVFEK